MVVGKTQQGYVIEFPAEFGHYKFVQMLGQGGFSCVAKVIHKTNGEYYAAKVVSRSLLIEADAVSSFETELRMYQQLNHPNIVKIFDFIYLKEVIIVVMEYLQCGDFFNILQNDKETSVSPHLVLYDVLKAISYLHKRNIAHLDIKPENIFIDSSGRAKLGDFGSSSVEGLSDLFRPIFGTYIYSSPEMNKGVSGDKRPSDIWAYGVLFYVAQYHSLPWKNASFKSVVKQIIKGEYIENEDPNPLVDSIIRRCLVVDTKLRATADELLEHPLFSRFRKIEESLPMLIQKPSRTIRQANSFDQAAVGKIIHSGSHGRVQSSISLSHSLYRNIGLRKPQIK